MHVDEQTSRVLAQTIANLAEIATRNTFGAISNKIKAAKTSTNKDKTVSQLEEIINELLNDKIELERITKTLDNELVSRQISDSDIDFIVSTVIPIVEQFIHNDAKQQSYVDAIKKLLSKETLLMMQLIGFNYREAIGIPLTRLCAITIGGLAETQNKRVLAELNVKYEMSLVELAQDKNSYNRFARMIRRQELITPDEVDSLQSEDA